MTALPLIRRIAAVGLLLALLAAGYAVLVHPVASGIADAMDRIAVERATTARLEQAARAAEAAQAAGPSQRPDQPWWLIGESDAVMVAALQTLVRAAMASEGGSPGGLDRSADGSPIERGRIVSTRALPIREVDGLRLVGIETRLTTTLAGLQRLLLALERTRPVLLIDAVQITPSPGRGGLDDRGQGQGQGQGQGGDLLDVRLELSGAAEPGAAASTVQAPKGVTPKSVAPDTRGRIAPTPIKAAGAESSREGAHAVANIR